MSLTGKEAYLLREAALMRPFVPHPALVLRGHTASEYLDGEVAEMTELQRGMFLEFVAHAIESEGQLFLPARMK